MEQKNKYLYQIRKTELLGQKDEITSKSISLEMIQSSSLVTYPMNRSNAIETNNLIYLNGAFITFDNFFQSNKQFISSVSEYPPIALVGSSIGKSNIAVVTQSLDKKEIVIPVYSYNEEAVATHVLHEELEFVDICFFNRTLVMAARKNESDLIYTFKQRSCIVIEFPYKIRRILNFENKIVILCQMGLVQFDEEKCQAIQKWELLFPELSVLDYVEVECETKILLTPDSLICHWFETTKCFVLPLDPQLELHQFVKIGRNILAAERNQLALAHFIIGEDDLAMQREYVYSSFEKLKGGIVSIHPSPDQMHLALGVEVKEKDQSKIENFIFNMSSLSKSSKVISPFSRMMSLGFDSGFFSSMVSLLSSNIYLLIGSKISNLSYTNTIEKKKVFNLYQVPRFMAAHPFGYQFICGFDGIVKFYNRVEADMQEIWKQNYICSAASYSSSGNLVLSIMEDAYVSLIIYDCYNFRKQRVIPVSYLKLFATKIDWVNNNSQLVLMSSNEMLRLKVNTGEKLSDFRDRQQMPVLGIKVKCIDYDQFNDILLAGVFNSSGGMILESGRTNFQDTNLQLTRLITLPAGMNISYIKIMPSLKTLFFGTTSGHLYWISYPLRTRVVLASSQSAQSQNIHELTENLNSLRLHHQPISFIGLTPNNRFLIVNIRGNGYFTFRTKWSKNLKQNQANLVFHELGNPILNTIDFSSCSLIETNKEKLKLALEKRKECFNDLEEFRRQCDARITKNLKEADISEKEKELDFINQVLADVEKTKEDKKEILTAMDQLDKQLEESMDNEETIYEQKMLTLYKKEDEAKEANRLKEEQYNQQMAVLEGDCLSNISEIQSDLTGKFSSFKDRYRMMIENLEKFQKRVSFQEREESETKSLLVQKQIQHLQDRQIELGKITNDLSVRITHCRKKNQRFCNRKGFLEHKIRFFQIEIQNCLKQAKRLSELKNELENNLRRLQINTLKKQQKLKQNIKSNSTLSKYRNVFEDLSHSTKSEINFVKDSRDHIDSQIVEMQKELQNIASTNKELELKLKDRMIELKRKKQNKKNLSFRHNDILYYVTEMSKAIEGIKALTEQDRGEKFKQVCQHFFEGRKVEGLINERIVAKNEEKDEEVEEDRRLKQDKILSELQDRKKYVVSNFGLLKDYNERAVEEINLNILQFQAQNYKLISQCNQRKHDTANKKKVLHELIDSVKETQIYLTEMKKSEHKEKAKEQEQEKRNLNRQNISEIPFVVYEKFKQEQIKQNCHITEAESTKAGFSRYHVRKVLDVKKMIQAQGKSGRRIMTAVQKKRVSGDQNDKPQTAIKKRGKRGVLHSGVRVEKSMSKPTLNSPSLSRLTYKPSFGI